MTCLLTIIAFNFWFVKHVVQSGSWITTTNRTGRPVPFIRWTVWSVGAVSASSFKSSSFSLGISKIILLLPHGLVIFPWDLVLKENSYFTIPLSRPPHNGTSFAASVGSSLPHVSLPSSPHMFSFDCIWPILLQSIMKYSLIQAYVTFQSYHIVFVNIPFSHCQLLSLILVKIFMLGWQWSS